ncbi:MAG: non-canonical purine NTP pyrophosphatase [Acidobacteriaceae bacterium]
MNPPVLYVATSNAGKLRDFSVAAKLFGVVIEPLPGVREVDAPIEDGPTFEANARIKAVFYSGYRPEALVLADDSGLEVDALGGAPGVRSARYAADSGNDPTLAPHPSRQSPHAGDAGSLEWGTPGDSAPLSTDARNNRHLLAQLAGVPEDRRSARYRCVLALARRGEVLATAEGAVEGVILTEPRGGGGFGYDPLFYLPELRLTMAEVDLETKQRLSHRGCALQALLQNELLRGLSSGDHRAREV